MITLFVVLIVAACILLMLVILVQNPKGGGLSSAFGGQGGGTQMLGGAKRSGDFLDKATWGLSIVILVMVLGMNMFNGGSGDAALQKSEISEEVQGVAPQLNINNDVNEQPAGEAVPAEEMPTSVDQ